jgi:hypothetical protein
MRIVEYSEIRNIAEYEAERESWRPRVLAIKERRRVGVGDHLTFLFENRDTVRYQIQEMMRIERIVREQDIRHELATYNELIPAANQLSACLLIEYETPELRDVWLRRLLGLENHVWIQVGSNPPAKGVFDTRQIASDRISSVQYVKFDLSAGDAAEFAKGARLFVDHASYPASTDLSREQLDELRQDLL